MPWVATGGGTRADQEAGEGKLWARTLCDFCSTEWVRWGWQVPSWLIGIILADSGAWRVLSCLVPGPGMIGTGE